MKFNPPSFRHRYLDLRPLKLQIKLDRTEGQLLGWGIHDPKWWRNYRHTHSFFEVCFTFQGKGVFRINDAVFTVKAGDLFLARPGEIHEIIADEADPLGIYYWSFILPSTIGLTPPETPLGKLVEAFHKNTAIIVAQSAAFEPVLQLVTAELNELAPGFTQGVQGLSHKLLIDTLRIFTATKTTYAGSSVHNSSESHPLLDPQSAFATDMLQFLHDNYQRPIKVRDVAAQVHLSDRHANRQFKLVTGRPIMTYLTEIRLEKAKALLLNPSLMIGDIALAVGIDDVRYFSTLFRKHVNLSPTAYRQQKGTTFIPLE